MEEAILQFHKLFLTCIVILRGDGKRMHAIGGAGSKCWLCKDPNGNVGKRGDGVHVEMGGIFENYHPWHTTR